MAKAIAEEHGAATLLSICPTRKSTASCYLLLNLYLRGSCHSSIHLCLSVSCNHGCSDFCSLLQHCSASCRKTSALPCVLYTSQHAVSLLIPSFSHSAYTQTSFLSSRSLLHLAFAYGWAGACFMLWQCACVCGCYVWRVHRSARTVCNCVFEDVFVCFHCMCSCNVMGGRTISNITLSLDFTLNKSIFFYWSWKVNSIQFT